MTQPHLADALGDQSVPDLDRLFAADARFRSPFTDYHGRADIVHLVGLIRQVLAELRVVRRLSDGNATMSTFEARVGGESVQGVLVEERDEDQRLTDVMLTVRPYPGLRQAMAAMGSLLEASPLPSRRADA